MNTKLPYLKITGSNLEIGRAHGEEYRDSIREFVELLKDNVKTRSRVRVNDKQIFDLIRKHWAYSLEYYQELSDEIIGIAEGAKVDKLDIFLINSFLELLNTREDRLAVSLVGCTSFGVSPEAAKDSQCYIGQNYEMEAFYKKYMILLDVEVPGKPRSLIYTYTGVVGCAGMNSEGIGVCINFLHSRDSTYGVVYPFIVRQILSQVRIGDAIGAVTIGHRAGGTNYLIGDSNGYLFDIETSARDHDILVPLKGILAHSNHYISDKMKKYDLLVWDTTYDSNITRRGSTIIRWHVANKILTEQSGQIDFELLQKLAQNKVNFPYSICFHGNPQDNDLLRGENKRINNY